MSADAPRVVPLSLRARVLAPIRGGLSLVGFAASAAASGRADLALIGWAAGAGVAALLLRADPRGRRHRRPEPLPAGVATESAVAIARTDVFPSTAGVAVLTTAALVFQPLLAALLAGILGGMALLTLVAWLEVRAAEAGSGGPLFVERRSKRVFVGTSGREKTAPTTRTRSPRG